MKKKQLYIVLQQIDERRSRIDADSDFLKSLEAVGFIKHIWEPMLTAFGKRVFAILDKERKLRLLQVSA